MSPNKRTFQNNFAADSVARKNRRRHLHCYEERWVDAVVSSRAAARRGEGKRRLVEVEGDLQPSEPRHVVGPVKRFSGGWYGVLVPARPLGAASVGSLDEVDAVDSGGYDADVESGGASSSSSHSGNDTGDSSQPKRRRYVEEIWFEAGAATAVRRGAVVGRGKRRLVTVDEGDPSRGLPIGAVKRFHGGWYGVLVSMRSINAGDDSTDEAVDSVGYIADAESGASSSLAKADEVAVDDNYY